MASEAQTALMKSAPRQTIITDEDRDAALACLESIAQSLETIATLAAKLEPIATLIGAEFATRAKGGK